MKTRRITVKDFGTADIEMPEICPKCGKRFTPDIILSARNSELFQTSSNDISVVFSCAGCDSLLVAHYPFASSNLFRLASCEPRKPAPRKFDDVVHLISTDFIEIYNQAKAAEDYGLTHIAGMGYRKALEFLVKSYAIAKDPGNEENIKKSMLGACISKYIDDKYVKQTAKAASWIGNDETHFQRLNEDKDIGDLKRYLDSCLFFIMAIMNTEESREMTDGKS